MWVVLYSEVSYVSMKLARPNFMSSTAPATSPLAGHAVPIKCILENPRLEGEMYWTNERGVGSALGTPGLLDTKCRSYSLSLSDERANIIVQE